MPPRYIEPSINSVSFSCPRCGALADQRWFTLYRKPVEKGSPLPLMTEARRDEIVRDLQKDMKPPKDRLDEFVGKLNAEIAGDILFATVPDAYSDKRVTNLFVSQCYSCNGLTLWRSDTILYPPARHGEEPNGDLPDDIKVDFEEARTILELSPRGAAALLRLCVQKLCKHLECKGRDLDTDIGTLVSKGLPEEVKQALDVVRVIGGQAVHPGQINLNDNRDVAAKLFTLVNIIADRMITRPNELQKLHAMIPPEKLEAIKRRDEKVKKGDQ